MSKRSAIYVTKQMLITDLFNRCCSIWQAWPQKKEAISFFIGYELAQYLHISYCTEHVWMLRRNATLSKELLHRYFGPSVKQLTPSSPPYVCLSFEQLPVARQFKIQMSTPACGWPARKASAMLTENGILKVDSFVVERCQRRTH